MALGDEYRVVPVVDADSGEPSGRRWPMEQTHLQIDAVEPGTIRLDGRHRLSASRRSVTVQKHHSSHIGQADASISPRGTKQAGAAVRRHGVSNLRSDVIGTRRES